MTARLGAIAAATLAALALLGWLLWPSRPAATALHSGTARYTVNATIDPPRIGDAAITIDLATRASNPATATVSVEAVMPLMGFATPALPATGANGHYTVADVPLMMTGPWELHVSIADQTGDTDDLTLPFTVTG